MKTLTLVKMGCDFFNDPSTIGSDVGNYRVWTGSYNIAGKDGYMYLLEFSRWRKQTKDKRNVRCQQLDIALDFNTYCIKYNDRFKGVVCCANLELETRVSKLGLLYTKSDILKAVNFVSRDFYTNIELISSAEFERREKKCTKNF